MKFLLKVSKSCANRVREAGRLLPQRAAFRPPPPRNAPRNREKFHVGSSTATAVGKFLADGGQAPADIRCVVVTGFQHTRSLLRTVKGALPRGSQGTIIYEME